MVEDVFNYGIFDVLDGQFLNDDSYISEFRLHSPNGATLKPFLFKYKSRIYKKNELVPKSKQIKCLQSRTNEKKFIEAIQSNNLEKLIKLAAKGFDPNFHCHDYANGNLNTIVSKTILMKKKFFFSISRNSTQSKHKTEKWYNLIKTVNRPRR